MRSQTIDQDPREISRRHRRVWFEKPVLREVYTNWYQRIAAFLPTQSARVVEIGGGSGNLKTVMPEVVSSDVIHLEWLDVVCDAQNLPFAEGSLDGIVMVDVLHHLPDPISFFQEVKKVLRPGGRLVIFDIYVSHFSNLVMKLFHPEPVDMKARVFDKTRVSKGRHPWESNQAVTTLIFWRHLSTFQKRFNSLKIVHKEISDLILYPLTGGFEFPSLVPGWAVVPLKKVEQYCLSLDRYFAFRSMVVIEKVRI